MEKLVKYSINRNVYLCENKGWVDKKEMECTNCGSCIVKRFGNKYFGICEQCGTRVYMRGFAEIFQRQLNHFGVLINYQSVGTGKTFFDAYRCVKECLERPGWKIAIVANTLKQLSKTIVLDLKKLVFNKNEDNADLVIQNEQMWEFTNGSSIEFWSDENVGSVRSHNVCGIVLVEAQSIKEEFADQMIKRIRHELVRKIKRDENGEPITYIDSKGYVRELVERDEGWLSIESNIELCWINRWILRAKNIYVTENVHIDSYPFNVEDETFPQYRAYIASLVDFSHLSDDYKQLQLDTAKMNDRVEAEIHCNPYAASDVLFQVNNVICKKQWVTDIEPAMEQWRVIFCTDLGCSTGATTMHALWICISRPGEVWVSDEYYETELDYVENGTSMMEIKQKLLNRGFNELCHTCDKMGRTTESDHKTILSKYESVGLYMTATKCKSVEKVMLQKLIELGKNKKIHIMNDCGYLIKELTYTRKIWDQLHQCYILPPDNNKLLGIRTKHAITGILMGLFEINFATWMDNFMHSNKYKVYWL